MEVNAFTGTLPPALLTMPLGVRSSPVLPTYLLMGSDTAAACTLLHCCRPAHHTADQSWLGTCAGIAQPPACKSRASLL